MSDALARDLSAWLLDHATNTLDSSAWLDGLVERLGPADLSLARVSVWIPTKHPELWGHQLVWGLASGASVIRRSHEVSESIDYVGTLAEALHRTRSSTLRCRLDRAPDRSHPPRARPRGPRSTVCTWRSWPPASSPPHLINLCW